MTGGTAFQRAISDQLTGTFERIQLWLAPIPEAVQGIGLLAVVAVFVVATVRRPPARRQRPHRQPAEQPLPPDAEPT